MYNNIYSHIDLWVFVLFKKSKMNYKWYRKILELLIINVFFFLFFANSCFALTVDAWPDQTITTWSEIIFNWSVWFTEDCDEIIYYRSISDGPRELFVDLSRQLSGANVSSDQTTTEWTYYFVLDVTWNYCGPDMLTLNEMDTMSVSIESWAANSPPNDITLTKDNIDENVEPWTSVWYLLTKDPDDITGEWIYKYLLVSWDWDKDNDSFDIVWSELRVNFSPDFEKQETYSIRIQTQDSNYDSYDEMFTITINDIDESVASIDAWSDQNVKTWQRVTLNWLLSWFPETWCNYEYVWSSPDITGWIMNSDLLTWAYFDTDSYSWSTSLNVFLEVIASSSEITHDSCWKTWTYNDNLYVNISEKTSWWWINHWEQMRQEAINVFNDLEKIDLKLREVELNDQKTYKLAWNYLWWNWEIKYDLLYSNNKEFTNPKRFLTSMHNKTFYKQELDLNSYTFFFKVRAVYDWEYSKRSNIVSITNKNSPLKIFKIICYECESNITFKDVLKSVDLLLNRHFEIKCVDCNSEPRFSDVRHSKDLILDRFRVKKENDITEIDFKDSLNR